jgi:hypothetical protein
MVLFEERHCHATPRIYGQPPCPPTQLGVRGRQEGPPQAAALAQGHSTVMVGGANVRAPSVDILKPPDSTTPSTGA